MLQLYDGHQGVNDDMLYSYNTGFLVVFPSDDTSARVAEEQKNTRVEKTNQHVQSDKPLQRHTRQHPH